MPGRVFEGEGCEGPGVVVFEAQLHELAVGAADEQDGVELHGGDFCEVVVPPV